MAGLSNRDIERRILDLVTGACAIEINHARYGRAVVVALPDHEAFYLLTMRNGDEERVLSAFASEMLLNAVIEAGEILDRQPVPTDGRMAYPMERGQ